jgi:hypothetical protein
MRLDSGLAAFHEKPFEPFMSEGFDHESYCSLQRNTLQWLPLQSSIPKDRSAGRQRGLRQVVVVVVG